MGALSLGLLLLCQSVAQADERPSAQGRALYAKVMKAVEQTQSKWYRIDDEMSISESFYSPDDGMYKAYVKYSVKEGDFLILNSITGKDCRKQKGTIHHEGLLHRDGKLEEIDDASFDFNEQDMIKTQIAQLICPLDD